MSCDFSNVSTSSKSDEEILQSTESTSTTIDLSKPKLNELDADSREGHAKKKFAVESSSLSNDANILAGLNVNPSNAKSLMPLELLNKMTNICPSDSDDYMTSESDSESDGSNDENKYNEEVKCPLCPHIAPSSVKLEKHVSVAHARHTTYKCRKCDFTCMWNREYFNHMKSHHPGPPYRCESCPFTCRGIERLLSHRMQHAAWQRPLTCSECDYRCKSRGNLACHMQCHVQGVSDPSQHELQADEPSGLLQCSYPDCRYRTQKKTTLMSHIRNHSAVRSHVCSTCGKAFIERGHLVRHERIHLNDKPFKCSDCEYSSSRRDKLKEHCRKHHGENATAKVPYKPRRPRTACTSEVQLAPSTEPTAPANSSTSTAGSDYNAMLFGSTYQSFYRAAADSMCNGKFPPGFYPSRPYYF